MKKETITIADQRTNITDDFNASAYPLVNGGNYFIGFLPPEQAKRTGQMGMSVHEPGDWRMLWNSIGEEAPGDLPEGAYATIFIDSSRPECDVATTATAAITDDGPQVNWEIRYSPVKEPEHRQVSYAVVIMPEKEGCLPKASMNYIDVVYTEAQRKGRVHGKVAALRAHAPKLKFSCN